MGITNAEFRAFDALLLKKGILDRADHQHDIAAYFGVNLGHINDIGTGECGYPNALPAKPEELPPPRPYMTSSHCIGFGETH